MIPSPVSMNPVKQSAKAQYHLAPRDNRDKSQEVSEGLNAQRPVEHASAQRRLDVR